MHAVLWTQNTAATRFCDDLTALLGSGGATLLKQVIRRQADQALLQQDLVGLRGCRRHGGKPPKRCDRNSGTNAQDAVRGTEVSRVQVVHAGEANGVVRTRARHLIRGSDPRTNVSHQVGVDPVDDAGIDISHLEQRWNLWISGTTIHPNHIRHPPGTIRVGDYHGHPCTDVQKDWIRLGRCNGACMVNRHTPLASTAVLVQE